jgi:2-(acetamidomethylene)succinate hydrolase
MPEASRAFQEKDVTLSNGLKLHYYEWPGPRPILVLLHPSSGYGRMWEWTVRHLGSRCHVFALDQRGHGDSGRPDGDYSAEEYAHDLYLFFEKVGIDKAIVAGQSLGGRVGQVFAATHPERIEALALVGGPHPSNFFPTKPATIKVLNAAQRMLESQTEFPSRAPRSRTCDRCAPAIGTSGSVIAWSTTPSPPEAASPSSTTTCAWR